MRSWITPSRRPAALLAVTLAGLAGGTGARLAGEELGVRHLPVVQGGRLVGVLSIRDLLAADGDPG